jgi:hypothetical protein
MRYGYWMPVFGGWLRNVEDVNMAATWDYAKRLAVRAEQISFHPFVRLADYLEEANPHLS